MAVNFMCLLKLYHPGIFFSSNRLFINEMNDILGGKPNHGLSVARKVVLVWVTLTRFLFFMLQAVTEIVPGSRAHPQR